MAALALAVTGTIVPSVAAAQAAPSPDHPQLKNMQIPRPERAAAADKPEFDPHTVLVKFKSGTSKSAKDRAVSRRSARVAAKVEGTEYVKVRTDGSAQDLLTTLRKDPAVVKATLDYRRYATTTPNDPAYVYGDQGYLNTVRMADAWSISQGTTSQVIAVLDTGVMTTHEDLLGRVVSGWNAISPGSSWSDNNGHGTEVAGIAGAATNNGIGIAGTAWSSKIMPVKVLDADGGGTDSTIAAGINWATAHGAKIINLSLGGTEDNPVLHDAIKAATAKGVLVVAAAGNDGDDTPQYPAAYPEVLAVGATDGRGRITDFSSSGDWVDVAAPGFHLTSTAWHPAHPTENDWYVIGDSQGGASGTSFSAPMVAGIAALVRTRNPKMTPAQVLARIKATARDAGPRGIDPYYGAGIVDANNAVGGRWAAEFPQLTIGDSNETPARATVLPNYGTSTNASIGVEGDLDWYRIDGAPGQRWRVQVAPPAYNSVAPQSTDPVVALYDADLKLIDEVDAYGPGATEQVVGTPGTGTFYIRVRNYNGARDAANYILSTFPDGTATPSTPGAQEWVRNVTPTPYINSQSLATRPTVTFARNVDPASVTTGTVKLVNGRTGATVAGTPTLSGSTVTFTPAAPLLDYTPYRIVVDGVRDTAGNTQATPYSSVFRTVDTVPGKVGSLTAKGVYRGVNLSWTLPNITDLDHVVVRMSPGPSAPAGPTYGTGLYAPNNTAAAVANLVPGQTYAFGIWVVDRSGKVSGVAGIRAVGTATSISSNTTSIAYGGTVTVTGKVTRVDTGAGIAGAKAELHARRKGTTTFVVVGTATSAADGTLSFAHKPSGALEYKWVYRGGNGLIGAASGLRGVWVATTVSATLSATSIPLGGSVSLTGKVAPSHAGQAVYLQRSVNGAWHDVIGAKLSVTSAYSFAIKPTAKGTYTYRVRKPGDTDHAIGYSSPVSFKVY
ncbi:Ig-like domain-containing protein [Micromonospora siamensis]|uniref:Ig-like domain-containing protein n=1 Tax=Micromonospora siamensis TaxID=299152 RepID=A0A1C5H4A9_9ACTN|nr:Ig-like domain-containing protein [Micromonospora siamensis]